MKVFYSDNHNIALPEGHRFPIEKYRMVREALICSGVLEESELFVPTPASPETVMLAHTPAYVHAICNGTADTHTMRRIGFPWSEGLATRTLSVVGGALSAASEALKSGISGNLGGGTHHALADAGEGYCVFNDLAVVALWLLKSGLVRRLAIIDLDVHQGNGNAAILGSHPDIFILSMHGDKNYPFRKVPSTLDIALPDDTGDDAFLQYLEKALPKVFDFRPEIILYQAGVDPLREDTLGRLALSLEGLKQRDLMVLSSCKKHSIPVSLALGGGYAKPITLTVEAHVGTYRAAREVFGYE